VKAEQLTDVCTGHGEGPVWDESARRLRWVDMFSGDVLSTEPSVGSIDRLHVGTVASAVRPRQAGGLVVAVERGFALVEADSSRLVTLPEVWSDDSVRMNDGACDPQGRFYCGSMAYDEAPGRGSLHRLDADHAVTTVLTGVTISNGLAWRADGERALYVDSPTRTVDEFDFDAESGTLHGRRPFVGVDAGDAVPDGIALDAEGGVWVALWGGASVRRYDDRGVLDATVELPVAHVTACALDPVGYLYITTSNAGGEDDAPAGALFGADVGIAGLPIPAYAG
jgi:sugar lactone lactonase YvrE